MHCIKQGFILPSAAFVLKRKQINFYDHFDKPPQPGDVVYGEIKRIGQHSTLENISGRVHMIFNGTRAIFVYGNRYAPDFYEGLVLGESPKEVDLLARSGLIGSVKTKNSMIKDPTRIKVLGYVCNKEREILNTINFPKFVPSSIKKKHPRAKMILVCGTSMNSGKSQAAAACCRVLSTNNFNVRSSKVTGTASLKDILLMNDAGAYPYTDFTNLGYPSTYLLPEDELLSIFNQLDLKYANNSKNYWIVEFADGIIERETAMLLASPDVKSRIHKLIFCANDAFGAIGGLRVLKEKFDLVPDLISGICSSSPLHIRELSEFTKIPVFNSTDSNLSLLSDMIINPN
ncbi:MAG: hypothetical protein JEZ06_03025 [Anaerolineaceae bacterium]|nr:hypothetical protein [Anaerolineaceae bacterium]